MPIYNGERFLSQALDALLAQTYTDWELVISDNASVDRTEEICRQYAQRDGRIRYYRQSRNMGAAPNFNVTFALARGEYFRWASYDDLCAPEHLERCVAALDAHPEAVLVYPRTLIIDEDGTPVGPYDDDLDLRSASAYERYKLYHARYKAQHRECNAVFGLIRSSALRETSRIGAYTASDMILLAELALRGQFIELPEALFWRRDHPRTSLRQIPSLHQRSAWFDPRLRNKLQLPHFRWLWQYLAAVHQAPLSLGDKLRCYSVSGQWVTWNWTGLKGDLLVGASYALGRSRLGNYVLARLRPERQQPT